jgi:hypothetical protein
MEKQMSNDREIREFLSQWIDVRSVRRKRKPAEEIMKTPTGPKAPRLEMQRGGSQRMVVPIEARPNWKRLVTKQAFWHLSS